MSDSMSDIIAWINAMNDEKVKGDIVVNQKLADSRKGLSHRIVEAKVKLASYVQMAKTLQLPNAVPISEVKATPTIRDAITLPIANLTKKRDGTINNKLRVVRTLPYKRKQGAHVYLLFLVGHVWNVASDLENKVF